MFHSRIRPRFKPWYVVLCFFIASSYSNMSLAEKARRLIWAHVYETSEPLHKRALWAAEEIKKRTDGRYVIDVFPMSTLGKEAQLNQSLSLGIVDIIYTGTSFAAQNFPALAISELPYVFRDFAHWDAFRHSDVFLAMSDEYALRSKGNRILACSYYGQRHLTSKFAITVPQQAENLKIRVPNAAVYKMFPTAMNANPSPIAFSEVYLALQQGVVDAQENPLPTIRAKKFYEVNKHINLTGHIIGSILTLSSDRIWNELSEADKVIFNEVFITAAQGVTQDIRQAESELIQWFEGEGVQVNEVDRAAFRAKTLPFHETVVPQLGREYYEKLQAL